MTAVFADSSALVKLYADELGVDVVRAVPSLIISQLARVEVPAALWRKHRLGELSAADTSVSHVGATSGRRRSLRAFSRSERRHDSGTRLWLLRAHALSFGFATIRGC